MNKTSYDRGFEKGLEQGPAVERRAILQMLLENRFGDLSAGVLAQLDRWPPERLLDAIKRVQACSRSWISDWM